MTKLKPYPSSPRNAKDAASAPAKGVATTEAILDAAERLWGTHGIEGASLREITLAAGSGNKSSIGYHFGDKHGVIDAIFRRRMPALEERRQLLLAAAKAEGRLNDTLTLFRIVMQPIFEEVDLHGRHTYAAFLRAIIRYRQYEGRANTQDLTPTAYSVLDMLREQASHLDQAFFNIRLRLINELCYDAMIDQDDPDPGFETDAIMAKKIFEDALKTSAYLLFLD